MKTKTPFGIVTKTTRDGALLAVSLPRSVPKKFDAAALCAVEKHLSDHQIAPGKATDFQRRVWEQLRRIPRGQTRSYAQVAAAIGRPRAARAVGGACGANPFLIAVPCHRVVASDGGLGGFASGLKWKRKLLELEGAKLAPIRV